MTQQTAIQQCVCDSDCRCRTPWRSSYCGCEVVHSESVIDGLSEDLIEAIRLVYADHNHSFLSLLIIESEAPDLLDEGVKVAHLEAFNQQLRDGFRCDHCGKFWRDVLLSTTPKVLCLDDCYINYIDAVDEVGRHS